MRFYYALYLLLTGALLISMLNSWLLDYAREEPVYRLDDTTLGRMASRRIQRVDIDPGTITLRLD